MKRPTIALALATMLLLAACGGGADATSGVASLDDASASDETNEVEETETSDEEALFEFAACMRDNGFDIDDPTVDADGNVQIRPPANLQDGDFDRDAAQVALSECENLLEGVTLGFGQRDDSDFQDSLLSWAQCMRDNGYDMDDPDFSGFAPGEGGGDRAGIGPFGDLDQDDPVFQEAMSACEDLLPGFGGLGRGADGGRG